MMQSLQRLADHWEGTKKRSELGVAREKKVRVRSKKEARGTKGNLHLSAPFVPGQRWPNG